MNLLPLKTDPEEAVVINKMFLEHVAAGNNNLLPNDDFKNKAKEIIMNMKNIVETQPKLGILNDEGKQLLQKVLNA